LGAIGGAILAGESEFIDHVSVWRRSIRGECFYLVPYGYWCFRWFGIIDATHTGSIVALAKDIASLLANSSVRGSSFPQQWLFCFSEGDIKTSD